MTHLLEQINHQRRRFFGVAAMAVGADTRKSGCATGSAVEGM